MQSPLLRLNAWMCFCSYPSLFISGKSHIPWWHINHFCCHMDKHVGPYCNSQPFQIGFTTSQLYRMMLLRLLLLMMMVMIAGVVVVMMMMMMMMMMLAVMVVRAMPCQLFLCPVVYKCI